MAKPESYKAYDQVAHPSAGGELRHPDTNDDALGKPHKQNQTEFEAKECPSSKLVELRAKQLGSNGTWGSN